MTDPAPAQMPSVPRILVVDPDERIRESLAGLIGIGQRCAVVGSAGQPDEALAFVRSHAPDVVVLDPRLPDLNDGRALIGSLRATAPGVRVVVMGSDFEGSLGADVDAVIRKTFRPRELIEAICRAAVAAPV
jgi:DNA-binding NarL/FixJ family response regulator